MVLGSHLNRPLNFRNIKDPIFAVIDRNYTAYSKVRDREVGSRRSQSSCLIKELLS